MPRVPPELSDAPLSRRSRHIEHVSVEDRHCRRSVIDHQAQLRVDGAQFLLRADPACDVGYERDVLSRPSLRIGDRGNKIADPDRRSAFGYESIFDLKLRFFELIHCADLVLGRSPMQASAATVSHGLQEIRTSNSCQETGNFEIDQRGSSAIWRSGTSPSIDRSPASAIWSVATTRSPSASSRSM